ncbi:MAG: hypothetical protein FLDDKLPJ_01819 [Phycisphaerae bacterium]|nr:hypothetical protein [Phycisphaerae bacterium]
MASGTYRRSTWGSSNRGTSRNTGTGTTGRTTGNCAPGYKNCYSTFNNKINAYRTLANQTTGSATYKRPSPTQLTSFANWVNKGCNVFCVSPTQISRYAPRYSNFNPNSISSVKTTLCNKFGRSTIKAVCRDKQGNFLICCSPTSKGKPFCFPC